jgi:uridine kinase
VDVILISQDDYYKSSGFKKVAQFDNWDDPSAIDFDRLVQQMISSRQQYPEHVIVVEGNMLYYDRRVLELCAAKYMISIDRETCLTRRLTRDDWLRDNATYFDLCVWPGYEQYLAHIAPLEDITLLDGAQSIEQLTDIILRRVSVTAGGQHEI